MTTTKLPPLVLEALNRAELFIRGFEGDEMQGGVPEEILGFIQVARLPWRDARHPGDHILTQYMKKGDEACGMVTVQDYQGMMRDGKHLRVGSFLPGDVECSPGDTPKIWPETKAYVADKFAAAKLFAEHVCEAERNGWTKVEN